MKVKALKREFEVKDVTFAEKREINRRNNKVIWGATFEGDFDFSKIDSDDYYDFIEFVRELSELKEKDFSGLSQTQIDLVLQAIATEYLSGSDSEKK